MQGWDRLAGLFRPRRTGAERVPTPRRPARADGRWGLVGRRGARLAVLALSCGLGVVALLAVHAHRTGVSAAETCGEKRVMNVVAHEDDDLLFMNPDVYRDVRSGSCVRTVYLTAGDAGGAPSYWTGRERGAEAAYARMRGAPDEWRTTRLKVSGRSLRVRILEADPNVSLVFMRLPDGEPNGAGTGVHLGHSLQKLWDGRLTRIATVTGEVSYSKEQLVTCLSQLMRGYRVGTVRVLDDVGRPGDGDHSDHHASAYFAVEAQRSYLAPHGVQSYRGYPVTADPPNVGGDDLKEKTEIFDTYGRFDRNVCVSETCSGGSYDGFLRRERRAGGEPAPPPGGRKAA